MSYVYVLSALASWTFFQRPVTRAIWHLFCESTSFSTLVWEPWFRSKGDSNYFSEFAKTFEKERWSEMFETVLNHVFISVRWNFCFAFISVKYYWFMIFIFLHSVPLKVTKNLTFIILFRVILFVGVPSETQLMPHRRCLRTAVFVDIPDLTSAVSQTPLLRIGSTSGSADTISVVSQTPVKLSCFQIFANTKIIGMVLASKLGQGWSWSANKLMQRISDNCPFKWDPSSSVYIIWCLPSSLHKWKEINGSPEHQTASEIRNAPIAQHFIFICLWNLSMKTTCYLSFDDLLTFFDKDVSVDHAQNYP
jgi:hypothetical protein